MFPFCLDASSLLGMRARVPQDVDLEDKLIYGLSPQRFAYVVACSLGALSIWRLEQIAAGLRVIPCLMLIAMGALLAWGRWRGRGVDGWLVDLVAFARRNYRVRPCWRGKDAFTVSLRAVNALTARPSDLRPPA